jgi:hypothetical protein
MSIEDVDLKADSDVSAPTSNNVVLVTKDIYKRIQTALYSEIGVEGLTLEDYGAIQDSAIGRVERDSLKVKMVLVGEFPVYFARERRVGIEAKVSLQIDPGLVGHALQCS